MPVENDETLADHTEKGGARTTADGVLKQPQRFKIYVPTAKSEIVLGLNDDGHQGVRAQTASDVTRTASSMGVTLQTDEKVSTSSAVALGVNDRGFVGVLTTIDHGNFFVCATGAANLGGTYQEVARTGTIIDTSVNLVRAGLMLWAARYNAGHAANLTQILGGTQVALALVNFATSPLSGGTGGGLGNMDYLKTGHVALFGARSVKLSSIEGVSTSAALFNSHSAGLSASVNSVLAASVNSGAVASVNAGFSASVNGNSASVIGGFDAGVFARVGTAKLGGQTILVGNKKQAGKKAQYLSGIQESTNDLWMRANDFIEVAVPSQTNLPEMPSDYALDGHLIGHTKHPTGLQIMKGVVRLGADRSSLKLTNEVTVLAQKSVLNVAPGGITIGRLKVIPQATTTTALNAARLGYHTAWAASEGIVNQLKAVWGAATGVGVLGAIAGVAAFAAEAGVVTAAGAGMGALAGKDDGDAGDGAKIGAIAGSVVGGVGVLVALGLAAMKTAGIAQRAGQKAAQKAYVTAVRAALTAERVTATPDPLAPKIEVTDAGIKLSVGPPVGGSSITLTSSGIEIVGAKVTINDIDMLPGAKPAAPTPPIIPVPDAPVIDDEGPSAELLTPGFFGS